MPDSTMQGYNLSPQQRRLWLRLRRSAHAPARARALLRVSGPLDLSALRRACELVAERHESLRTSFYRRAGMRLPLQVVAEEARVGWAEQSMRWGEVDGANGDGVGGEVASTSGEPESPTLTVRVARVGDGVHEVEMSVSALCADWASLGNLTREVARCYEAVSVGTPPPDEAMQYADYADWQNELLEAEDEEALAGKAFWRRQEVAPAASLKLPYEVSAEGGGEFIPEKVATRLDGATLARLVSGSESQSCTVEGYLLACWAALLWRLSGSAEEVAIAERVSGRKYAELGGAVGAFEKWLPVRVVVAGGMGLDHLLAQIEARRSEVREWQDYYPCEADADGDAPAAAPSFGFAYDEEAGACEAGAASCAPAGPVRFTLLRREACAEEFKIQLSCLRRDDSLEVEIHYDASVLRRRDAERIANQFAALVRSALQNPDARVGDLSPLGEEEREHLLRDFNRTEAPFPRDKAVHHLFEEQVVRTPRRVAVVCGRVRLTYAELNSKANQLARLLQRKGVREGVCVGLCMERSAEALVGMLGVLKAGGAYVPLSIDAPRERLLRHLEEIQSPVLLTQEELLRRLPEAGAAAIQLGGDEPPYGGEPADDLRLPCAPDQLAYVIYTSGSTGRPKGVAVTHRNLVNYAHFICHEFGLHEASADEGLNFATVSTIAADLGNTVIFPSLMTGGCLHVLSNEVATDARLFAGYVERHSIDVLKIVPSHLHALLDAPEGVRLLPRRHLFLGGEAFTKGLLKTLAGMGPACEVINHYGPTEATVGALFNRLGRPSGGAKDDAEDDAEEVSAATVPVGRPVANAEAYVLDENLRPVPVGVAGELYLGGEGLARGYLRQPAQTAERFVPHPYAKRPGARLYRTGDVARHLPNGRVEFLGRADDQVKIHGYRIELGEVVEALRTHASVRDAVVVAREDAGGPKRLVAYAACAPGSAPSVNELRAHMSERLPEYMIPSAFVFLERLPLTPNGKVDRRALPAPASSRATKERTAPRTDAERTLAAIWQEVLRVEQVGVHDNFFELGGDSILSIQIIARARQAGLRLLPKQIFSAQTIAELASVAAEDAAPSSPATQEPVTGDVPLTPVQHSFFERRLDNPHHFNQAVLLRVPAGVEAAHMRAALAHLLTHHDALRLRFTREGDGWRQRHAEPGGEVPFAEVDLSGVEEGGRASAVEAEAERWQRSLNLGEGPLVRMVLMRLGEGIDARLLIVAHHLVVDGVSWRILLDDLQLAYEQARRGEVVRLPAKTLSFKQWAERLSEFARSEELAAEAPYWLEASGRGGGGLPSDDATGQNSRASAQTATAGLSAEETEALLRDVPKAYRTEIADVLMTALLRATWRWGGRRALLVEMEGHGREEFGGGLDVTRTVGWFTTHYPVLLELEDEEEPAATLKRVKERLRAVPRRGLGFGLLKWMRGDVRLAEELRSRPSADIKFNYLGQLDAALRPASQFVIAPESSGATQDGSGRRPRLLEVNAAVLGGRLHLRWTFSPEVHRPESVRKLVESYTAELRGLIRHCRSADVRGFTPSDFPAAQLSQQELDSFISALSAREGRAAAERLANVEDIYRLSPMQEGLLFHSLLAPESDVYFRQLSCALQGELNVSAFARAWQRVLDEHPALRTSFRSGGGLKSPLQVVSRRAELPLTEHDWRGLSPDEQSERLEALIREERRRGFDLSQAPLMRLVLVRLADAAYHFVWSYHHLLMDGWAKHSVFNQILECYKAFCRGQEISLVKSRPYGDYIKWLQRQDMQKAEAYWRRTLDGFDTPTPVGGEGVGAGAQATYDKRRVLLPEQATSALQRLTRGNQLTLNTVMQGAWGLFLSRAGRRGDVVFGAVVSGRPADLEGSEKMIGLFVNTLPVRVQVEAGTEVLAWLRRLQEQQVEMQQYEYSPLVLVQNWSGVPRGVSLFESLLVFENYPVEAPPPSGRGAALRLSNFNIIEYSNFPLTLMVGPGRELSLLFLYDSRRFDGPTIDRMLLNLGAILNSLADVKSGTRVQDIHDALDEAARQEQLLKEKELKQLHLQKLKSVRRRAVRGAPAAAPDEAV